MTHSSISDQKLSRRRFLQTTAFAAAGSLLAACVAPGGAAPQTTTGQAGGAAAPAQAAKTVIHYWLPPTTEEVYRKQKISEFMQAHPDIEIKMEGSDPSKYNEATQLLFRQDNPPDIFWKYNLSLPQMIDQDMIQPYPDEAQAFLKKAYPPSMFLEGINMWKGQVYGFWPVGPKSATRVLYCNNGLFDQAGVKPPTNWSELRTAAKALAAAGKGQSYGLIMGGKSPWDYTGLVGALAVSAGPMMSADGEESCMDWTSGQMTIAVDYTVSALEQCTGMMKDGSIFPGFSTISHTEARAGLANNWAGMYMGGWWDAGAYNTQFPNFDYSVVAPPAFDGGHLGFNHGNPFIDRVYISKKATDLEAINKFLIFTFGPDYQKGWAKNGWFTTLPEANTSENVSDPRVQAIFKIADDIRTIPQPVARNPQQALVNAKRKEIHPNWGELLDGVFSGQIADADYKKQAQGYADQWRAELERAIGEVKATGVNVSIDDWIFANWNRARTIRATCTKPCKAAQHGLG